MRRQKLTNQEIARVFSMYFGSQILIESENFLTEGKMDKIDESMQEWSITNFGTFIKGTFSSGVPASDCKLKLSPLSLITDEHAIEVAKIVSGSSNKDIAHVRFGKNHLEQFSFNGNAYMPNLSNIFLYLYLIKQGYSVPLFFGVGHWANGKTAIELEIAIDKSKL